MAGLPWLPGMAMSGSVRFVVFSAVWNGKSMQPISQRVLTLEGPLDVRFVDKPLPPAGPRDVVVKSRYSTFKHGTEMLGYSGTSTFTSKVFNHSLRLFEEGQLATDFYPRTMGSMVVGEVLSAGQAVEGLKPGSLVFGWAPIADVHVLRASDVQPLDDLSVQQALCIDPASFALGGLQDGGVKPQETVLVTGLGAIGLFVTQYCCALGATVLAASSFESRRNQAAACGATRTYDTRAHKDLGRSIKHECGGVDVAIECSGIIASLNHAVRATRQCGRVVCIGVYRSDDVGFNMGEEFLHNRISLLASLPALSWNNPTRANPPMHAKELQAAVINDFCKGRISADGILRPTLPFSSADQAPKLISEAPEKVLKVLIDHS
jgi:threonine dehydrogenase-like Zn-dependent dehydrogenase